MTGIGILQILQKEIHSTVVATVDENGYPQTCVIDMMLADEKGLYFLTAKGKAFYERLMTRRFVAVSGMKGTDTMSTFSISVRGYVRNIGKERLSEIFEKNLYMAKIYPSEKSREALEVFQLYKGEGEYFDLGQIPPFRQNFSFGGEPRHQSGYRINAAACIGCQSCRGVCPVQCISDTVPRVIDENHCLHCGNCLTACPANAIEKLRI